MSKLKKTLGRYVDPRTDYGFKFYFGREENKENLINFLNSLFAGEKVIKDLHFQDGEHDGDDKEERKVILDLYCIGTDGEHFLIEMQQIFQDFFRDRAVFYTSRVIQKQVKKGFKGNTYELPEVYFIGVLEFSLDEGSDKYFYDVVLCDKETNEVFYEKLGYKFIVLPNFNKREDELETIMDQWLYLLKHLSEMDEIPKCLDKRIFGRIFDVGEVANLRKEERMSYEASLKQKRDWESVLATVRNAGRRELEKELEKERARAEAEKIAEKRDVVRNLVNKFENLSDDSIATLAVVSVDLVKDVRKELNKNSADSTK